MPPRNRVRNLIIPLALCGLLVLGLVLTLRRVPPAPPSPVVLTELCRTNLVHRDGMWFQSGHTNAFMGILLEFYPDGSRKSRSAVANGLLNGLSEGWYTNGQLQVSETYRANFSDGLRTKWYSTGKKLSEAKVVMGKMEGVYRRWYPDGTLSEEIPMRDGQIDGVGHAYYQSGFVKATVEYRVGKVVAQHNWTDGEQKGG